jgi:CubicO group peptidase (beta-lactamase class C family)/D-alanyl-D-alanine dipeptidase
MRRRLIFFGLVLCFLPTFILRADDADPQKYKSLIEAMRKWLTREIEEKGIPALSWALVDDQQLVWSEGHGYRDPARKASATGDTVYRVGSVSKPITALLLMMLVEQGLIDLDVPVQNYLPDFQPRNTTGKKITLRQMLAHRSGLVREAPIGNYFDASEPTLAQTVASLNRTELVFVPETTASYSNAALATVGLLLEKTQNEPFARLMQRKLLDPLGMVGSTYVPTLQSRQNLAKAIMWTYHGKIFAAPTWELGMPSAGSLQSTVNDQAKLLSFLFADGTTADGKQLLKRETLQAMFKIQYGKPEDKAGFGISFLISEFEGKKRIGHGGAVYGFATDFSALPDDKLGVVVMASKDVANAVTKRVSDCALRGMLALRQGNPLPRIQQTTKISQDVARALAGRYRSADKEIELTESAGRLYLMPLQGGTRTEVRVLDEDLIVDDVTGFGPKITRAGEALTMGSETFQRVRAPKAEALPDKWQGLIGEYGPDHNILYILEKDGKLHALIEWVFFYPLEEVTPDVYKFPSFGLYMGDKIVFQRDNKGRAIRADAASVPFARRDLKGENTTYKINPVRPVEELRALGMGAKPPDEKGAFFKKADLVDVAKLEGTIKLDIRYATADNFLGTPVYTSARAFLQRPAVQALVRAHNKLKGQGYGLLIHDAYRPWHITKLFFDATPPQFHLFVADPQQGSRHNRGCAVDLTLYDLMSGKAVDMVSGYDEFSDRAYPDYVGGTTRQRGYRDTLRSAMEAEGFQVYEAEWWHFDYRDWRQYPIMNARFEDVGK